MWTYEFLFSSISIENKTLKILDFFYLFYFSKIVMSIMILINLRVFRANLHMYTIRNFKKC